MLLYPTSEMQTNMKKLMMVMGISAAVLGVAASAMAQGAGPKNGGGLQQGNKQGKQGQQGKRMQMRGKMQKEILAKLNLTDAQKTKWEETMKAMREEMKAGAGEKGEKRDRKAQMEKMKGWQEKLMAILTTKQQAEYKKLTEEAIAKYRKENGGGAPGQGGKKGGGGL